MRIFTSRYSNKELAGRPDLVKIGITLGHPRFKLSYSLATNYRSLAPTRTLFQCHDLAEFRPLFLKRLDELGAANILSFLHAISEEHGGRDLVLLCFEDLRSGERWCHRRVVAEWLESNGWPEQIVELEQADPQAKAAPSAQPNLF
jgi:hypothetical protein